VRSRSTASAMCTALLLNVYTIIELYGESLLPELQGHRVPFRPVDAPVAASSSICCFQMSHDSIAYTLSAMNMLTVFISGLQGCAYYATRQATSELLADVTASGAGLQPHH
jgi:hypothetical protein